MFCLDDGTREHHHRKRWRTPDEDENDEPCSHPVKKSRNPLHDDKPLFSTRYTHIPLLSRYNFIPDQVVDTLCRCIANKQILPPWVVLYLGTIHALTIVHPTRTVKRLKPIHVLSFGRPDVFCVQATTHYHNHRAEVTFEGCLTRLECTGCVFYGLCHVTERGRAKYAVLTSSPSVNEWVASKGFWFDGDDAIRYSLEMFFTQHPEHLSRVSGVTVATNTQLLYRVNVNGQRKAYYRPGFHEFFPTNEAFAVKGAAKRDKPAFVRELMARCTDKELLDEILQFIR